MLRVIWTCVVLGLVGGVFLLGSAIFTGSSKMEQELTVQRDQMVEKMLSLKEEALKKGADAGRVLKKIADPADPSSGTAKGNADPGGEAGRRASEATAAKSEGTDAGISLDPMDEEDRHLTAAVMNHGKSKKQDDPETAEKPDRVALNKTSAEAIDKTVVEENPAPSPDFERLNRINELYVKTMQLLDFN